MRQASVHARAAASSRCCSCAFRYPSARDTEGGVNAGVLSPAAFGAANPRALETWHGTATRDRVELLKRDYFKPSTFTFMREAFLVGGVLLTPAP